MHSAAYGAKTHQLLQTVPLALALAVVVAAFAVEVDKSFLTSTVHIRPVAISKALRPTALPVAAPPQLTIGVSAHDYTIPPVENGTVPVITRIPTKEKVAFLTIDDGIVTSPSDAQLMQAAGVKATFFLVYRFINTDYSFFSNLAVRTGSDIENHTYDHYLLTGLNYDQQKVDICKNADTFNTWFGRRPSLLRPSGGAYNVTTLHAAADCGVTALIMWDASINNGVIKYQNGTKMQPGDIVLMHFRSTFEEDLNAFVQAARSSGLQPDLLVNWL